MQVHVGSLAFRKAECNSVMRIYAISDLLSNGAMKDIDEIRRDNMRLIQKDFSGPTAAATAVGMSLTQFINLRDGAPDAATKKPRGMRKSTARKIESGAGKPRGWLDVDHSTEDDSGNHGEPGGEPDDEGNVTKPEFKSKKERLIKEMVHLMNATDEIGCVAMLSAARAELRHHQTSPKTNAQ